MYIARKRGIEGGGKGGKGWRAPKENHNKMKSKCCCLLLFRRLFLLLPLFWAIIIAHDVVVVALVAATAVQFTLLNYVQHLWVHFLDAANRLTFVPHANEPQRKELHPDSPFLAVHLSWGIPWAGNKINYYSHKKTRPQG